MTTDQFQQYLFKKVTQIKTLTKTHQADPTYLLAISDVIAIIEKDREEIVASHAKLKELGLVI